MLKAKGLCYRLVKSRKATTCALSSEPPSLSTSAAVSGDHRSRCLSLIVKLGQRGLVDSAREVTRRVIDNCSSISEAALVADFAVNNGIELDSCCCGALIRKLTEMGQPGLAERLYNQRVIGDGIVPDSSVLDSMVLCLVKLRKFDEARAHLDRCLASGYVPSRNSASLVVDELCNQDRFLDAFLYFEQVKVKGTGLWLWCCKRLFKGLCIHGQLDEAIGMLDVLCEMTSTPLPINLYKSLFYGFCRRGCGYEVEALFDHMETDGYFVDLLMKMLDNGVVPDHITYFVLLKMLPRCHELKYAMVILQAIVDNGCGIDPPIIDGNIEVKVESLLEEIARNDECEDNVVVQELPVVTTRCFRLFCTLS